MRPGNFAECPACAKWFQITKQGKIRTHSKGKDSPADCDGSGQKVAGPR